MDYTVVASRSPPNPLPPFLHLTLKHIAIYMYNAMQRAEGFVLERALVISCDAVVSLCVHTYTMYVGTFPKYLDQKRMNL